MTAARILPTVASMLLFAGPALAAGLPDGERVVLAYIDPATGSVLVQALVAAVAGAGLAARRYWQQIRRFLGLSSDEPSEERPPEAPRDDA